jgi:hypothetical protein
MDLDKSTQIMMSLPTDLISFFESPKEGPRKAMSTKAKNAVRNTSLTKIV